jgi:uncharacterized protein (DUF433 family)
VSTLEAATCLIVRGGTIKEIPDSKVGHQRETAFVKMPYNKLYEEPAYGVPEAAAYLKVPYQTLRYWLTEYRKMPPMIKPVQPDPVRLSFLNLLECHALAGMRKIYDLKIPRVRRALQNLSKEFPQPHPLISQVFLTDRRDLFIEKLGKIINVSQHGEKGLNFYHMHLQRVDVSPLGLLRFFPFVRRVELSEPKSIEINPMVGFGKPVLSGTDISTAIIASRFRARDSVTELAREYGCTPQQVEEAIRWEDTLPAAD